MPGGSMVWAAWMETVLTDCLSRWIETVEIDQLTLV